MNRGIELNNFLSLCDGLYTSISKRLLESVNGNNDHFTSELKIILFASQIIDDSNGFINTSSEELIKAFDEVFQASIKIKQSSQELSHYEAEIERAKDKNDVERLEQSIKFRDYNKKRYLEALKSAIIAIAKVKAISFDIHK